MLRSILLATLCLCPAMAFAGDPHAWMRPAPFTQVKASVSCPCGDACKCGADCGCPTDGTCLCNSVDKELRDLRAYKIKMEAWLTEQGYRNKNVQWSRPVAVSQAPVVRLEQPAIQYDCSSGQCVPVQSNRYIGNGWFGSFKSFRGGSCANGQCGR